MTRADTVSAIHAHSGVRHEGAFKSAPMVSEVGCVASSVRQNQSVLSYLPTTRYTGVSLYCNCYLVTSVILG